MTRPHMALVAPPVERVTHLRRAAHFAPPTDYSRNVSDRWAAMLAAYHGERNRERESERAAGVAMARGKA